MSKQIFSLMSVAITHYKALGYKVISKDTDYARMELEGRCPKMVTIKQRDAGVVAEEFIPGDSNNWVPAAWL
jgi:hypothetical protein